MQIAKYNPPIALSDVFDLYQFYTNIKILFNNKNYDEFILQKINILYKQVKKNTEYIPINIEFLLNYTFPNNDINQIKKDIHNLSILLLLNNISHYQKNDK